MTISVTPRATTAYSIVAETPPGSGPKEGTIFPALRITNSWPGSCWVTSSGTRRLSEQEINSALGFWLEAAAEELFTLRENLFLEVEEALNDMLHSSVSFLCFNDDMTKITFSQFITDARNGNRYSNRR